jgi:hypothetical protein
MERKSQRPHSLLILDFVRCSYRYFQAKEPEPTSPLFTIPLQFGGKAYDFSFYAGDYGNSAIARFLVQVGVTDKARQEALYPDLLAIVEDGIRNYNEGQAAKATAAEKTDAKAAAPKKPMFTVAITVDDVVKEVSHYDGAAADTEAQTFCESNGFSVNNPDQLRQCMEVVVGEMQKKYAAMQVDEVAPAATQRRALFTLPITVNGGEKILTFFSGTTPRESATAFCDENDLANDPTLSQYITALEVGSIVVFSSFLIQ